MAFNVVVTIKGSKTVTSSFLSANSKDGRKICNAITNHIMGMAGGDRQGTLDIQINGGTGVAASGTLTLSSVVAGDTCAIAGQTFTAEASPSGNNQYAVGVSDTATATNLAAAISAHPSLAGVVSATSASTVVTITCAAVGLIGNSLALSGSTDIVASGSALSGGSNAAANTFTFGGSL